MLCVALKLFEPVVAPIAITFNKEAVVAKPTEPVPCKRSEVEEYEAEAIEPDIVITPVVVMLPVITKEPDNCIGIFYDNLINIKFPFL